jgi:hypothetical protein
MNNIEILVIGAMLLITGAGVVTGWNKKMWNFWVCLVLTVFCLMMMWLSYVTGMFEPLVITRKLGWSVFAVGAIISGVRSIWSDDKKYPAIFTLLVLLFSMLVVLRLIES